MSDHFDPVGVASLKVAAACPQQPLAGAPFHVWRNPDGSDWLALYRDDDRYLLRFPGLADFAPAADFRSAVATPSTGVTVATVQHLYLNQILPVLLGRLGKLVFHGSSVAIGDGAVAFLAAAGRGKSTLAASFAVRGNPFLSDDGLVLEPQGDGYLVQPSHASIRLWEDSEAELLADHPSIAPEISYNRKARLLAGSKLTYCDSEKPLIAAYLLGTGTAADTQIQEARGGQALLGWLNHSFILDIEDRQRLGEHFDRTAALAARVPCYTLDYARDYKSLPRVMEDIRSHVRTLRSLR